MTAALTYSLAFSPAEEERLHAGMHAQGHAPPSTPNPTSTPGLLLLGDVTQAPQWQRLGHRVIACGSEGAYSIDEALALLADLRSGVSTGGEKIFAVKDYVASSQETFFFGDLLDPLVRDPAVSDLLVNGTRIWVDRGRGLGVSEREFDSVESARRLAVRIAAYCGRRLDEASPIVDATLPSGIRLHAVLSPIAIEGPLISLRIPSVKRLRLEDMCVGESAALLTTLLPGLIQSRANCLISGATGSGKTTLLSTLLALVPPEQRVVCIEEVSELRPNHPHIVHLQERAPNVQGAGGVSLSELVRAAVRMRPDRIVVGECRGAEVREMLSALNTGHDGGWATIHANSAEEVPARLQALGTLAGLSAGALTVQARAAFDLVIHMQRGKDGRRRIGHIAMLGRSGELLRCERALTIDEDGACRCGPQWEQLCALSGIELAESDMTGVECTGVDLLHVKPTGAESGAVFLSAVERAGAGNAAL